MDTTATMAIILGVVCAALLADISSQLRSITRRCVNHAARLAKLDGEEGP